MHVWPIVWANCAEGAPARRRWRGRCGGGVLTCIASVTSGSWRATICHPPTNPAREEVPGQASLVLGMVAVPKGLLSGEGAGTDASPCARAPAATAHTASAARTSFEAISGRLWGSIQGRTAGLGAPSRGRLTGKRPRLADCARRWRFRGRPAPASPIKSLPGPPGGVNGPALTLECAGPRAVRTVSLCAPSGCSSGWHGVGRGVSDDKVVGRGGGGGRESGRGRRTSWGQLARWAQHEQRGGLPLPLMKMGGGSTSALCTLTVTTTTTERQAAPPNPSCVGTTTRPLARASRSGVPSGALLLLLLLLQAACPTSPTSTSTTTQRRACTRHSAAASCVHAPSHPGGGVERPRTAAAAARKCMSRPAPPPPHTIPAPQRPQLLWQGWGGSLHWPQQLRERRPRLGEEQAEQDDGGDVAHVHRSLDREKGG